MGASLFWGLAGAVLGLLAGGFIGFGLACLFLIGGRGE